MSRPKKKWFRLYVEMTRDLKIRKLSPQHKWLWVAVLSAVCESPVNSKLMLSESLAVDEQTLSDYAGMRVQDVRRGLKNLTELNLIEWDADLETWSIPRWSERQFESDDVAIRVAKHRYMKQDCNVTIPLHETLQDRSSKQLRNAPETDTDTELKELKKESKDSFLETQEINQPNKNPDPVRKTARTNRAAKTPEEVSPAPQKSSTTVAGETKTRNPRIRDLVFEAIAEVCKIDYRNTTESELGQVRRARRELKAQNATPEEVYRKAGIYHKMFPGALLTPMALVKYWSRLEEENIPKTKAELNAEDLERTFERLTGRTPVDVFTVGGGPGRDNHVGGIAPSPLSVDNHVSATRDRAQVTERVESATPFMPATDTHEARNGDSVASNGAEHGFRSPASGNPPNRSTGPLVGKPVFIPVINPPNGSLASQDRIEPYDEPAPEPIEARAPRSQAGAGNAAKSAIAELAKQLSGIESGVPGRESSVPESDWCESCDEPDWSDADIESYIEDPTW